MEGKEVDNGDQLTVWGRWRAGKGRKIEVEISQESWNALISFLRILLHFRQEETLISNFSPLKILFNQPQFTVYSVMGATQWNYGEGVILTDGFCLQGKHHREKISPSLRGSVVRGTVPGGSFFCSRGSGGSFSSMFPHASSSSGSTVFLSRRLAAFNQRLAALAVFWGAVQQLLFSGDVTPAVCRTVRAVKLRCLFQSSLYVSNPRAVVKGETWVGCWLVHAASVVPGVKISLFFFSCFIFILMFSLCVI